MSNNNINQHQCYNINNTECCTHSTTFLYVFIYFMKDVV